jgi:putative addiction module antidote
MPRKIFRTGNSAVVSLPADVLQAIGLGLGDEVTVTADPERGQIIITPVVQSLPGVRAGFLDRVDRFIDRYQPALEQLAKEKRCQP